MAQPRSSLFALVARPFQQFFMLEAASGVLLLASAVAAFAVANSPLGDGYRALLSTRLWIGVGAAPIAFTVQTLINDGLMTLFFFVVGMEIKRELAMGELRTPARAALPAIAAVGGMLVPAGIYFLLNRGGPGAAGWGIPMATDIAFCVGILVLLRSRVPHALVVFVTALAIFDDIGGILVIALFYGSGVDPLWLGAGAAVVGGLVLVNRLSVRSGWVYALLGGALWYALHHGGIHATIAGVVVGLAIPVRPRRSAREVLRELQRHTDAVLGRGENRELEAAELLAIEERIEELEAPLPRFVHALHPVVAFGVMPVFAFVNSGVDLTGLGPGAWKGPVFLGTALGLFFGKQLGIFAFTFAAVRARLAPVPGGASLLKLHGVSTVAGIGFTVALFIASLAFAQAPAVLDEAKLGILVGSAASGLVGAGLLLVSGRLAAATGP